MSFQSLFRFEEVVQIIKVCVLFTTKERPLSSYLHQEEYAIAFSCGRGGTPINFIMEHEQMTYVEALRWLARKYNIEIKERELTDKERQEQSERDSMFIVNEWAADYFEANSA